MLTATVDPAGMRTPSTSVSRVAVRMIPSSGGSHRSPSSIACGISSRSARSASSWSGLREQADEEVARRPVRRLGTGGEQQRRNAQISSSVRRVPSSSAWASTEMTSSDGCARRSAMIRRSSRTAVATRLVARSRSKPALMSSTRLAVEHRQVFAGQAEHACDHDDGERERDRARGRPGHRSMNVSMCSSTTPRTTSRSQISIALRLNACCTSPRYGVVLGLVHLEDGVTHHLAHHLGVPGRRERLAVLQHLLHRVEAERGEHADRVVELHEVDADRSARLLDGQEVFALDRVLRSDQGEDRIRVLDDAHAGAAIEVLERVVVVVRLAVAVIARRRYYDATLRAHGS